MSSEPDQSRAAAPIADWEAKIMERGMGYLREHWRTATVKDVAAHVGLSECHFHRRFTLWAGRTPKAIQTDLQMEEACKLLLKSKLTYPEIAKRCGFATQSHFASRFRMAIGDAPSRWLLSQRRAAINAKVHHVAA